MRLPASSYNFFLLASMSLSVQAIPFGTFDARSIAMGGAGVAAANGTNASFFNPAMLARFNISEDKGKNSRFVFPIISTRYSETLINIDDFNNNDYKSKMVTAINTFNNGGNTQQDAQAVLDLSRDFQSGLNEISSGPFALELNIGLTLGIPAKNAGGAILYSQRVIGDGVILQSPEDRLLLSQYVETAQFLASGGSQGVLHANLSDGTTLNDQTGNLTSTARGTAVKITELGMSFARVFSLYGQQFSLGFTPKYVTLNVYDIDANATDDSISGADGLKYDSDFNLDLGFDKVITSTWRTGLVIKNLISRQYQTELGNDVLLETQLRAGIAYTPPWGIMILDLDLTENAAIGAGDASQIVAAGGEFRLHQNWRYRVGLNKNIKATGDHNKILLSSGLQYLSHGIQYDTSYAENGVEKAIALQVVYRF